MTARTQFFKDVLEMAQTLKKVAFQPASAVGAPPPPAPPPPDPVQIAAAGGMPPPAGAQPAAAPMAPSAPPEQATALPPELDSVLVDIVEGLERASASIAQQGAAQTQQAQELEELRRQREKDREELIRASERQQQLEKLIGQPVGLV